MEIKQLKALSAIAEAGSFSVAADKLRLTQSALSHQIKNLEDELGETLLIRGRARVVPTAAGQHVLASAQNILAEVTAIRERFEAASPGPVTGVLRIAATNLGMASLYGDLCEDFMARYPSMEVTLCHRDAGGGGAARRGRRSRRGLHSVLRSAPASRAAGARHHRRRVHRWPQPPTVQATGARAR